MSGIDLASLTARKKPLLAASNQPKRENSRLARQYGHTTSVSQEKASYQQTQKSIRIDNQRSQSPGRDGYDTLDE